MLTFSDSVQHQNALVEPVHHDLISSWHFDSVYPFPIVFALHNGSAAWSYVLHWDWDVTTLPGTSFDMLASGGYAPGFPGEEKPPPPPDSYLITAPVSKLINTTDQELVLRYGFGIRNSCNETTREVPEKHDLDVFFNGAFLFRIDRKNGQVPDIEAAGPCATPVGSIGVEKEVRSDGGKACPVLKAGPQHTQTCALLVNDTVASQVATVMLREASCPDQSWPNVTVVREVRTSDIWTWKKVDGNYDFNFCSGVCISRGVVVTLVDKVSSRG